MNIRPLRESDGFRLLEIHANQGFEYQLPNIAKLATAAVLEDGGEVQMAILCRPTIELYMLSDNKWGTPGMRLEAFKALHEYTRRELEKLGYEDANAWIPPQVCRSFGRRLRKLFGWQPNTWDCYSRQVKG